MADDLKIQVILKGLDQLSGPLGQSTAAVNRLGDATRRTSDMAARLTSLGGRAALAGLAIGAGAAKAVATFATLESARVNLENDFTTKNGVSEYFKEIQKQVMELGQKMPGSELDFAELAMGMKEAGAEAEMMARGGLKAAASLKVISGLGGRETGQFFQEMSNQMGIGGEHADYFADALSRMKIASGLGIPGLHDAFSYMGGDLKTLNIQGKESVETVLAMAGGMKKFGGLADSQVGTSMGQFFNRLAMVQAKLRAGDSRGAAMRAAFEGLEKAGVDLRFFGDKGEFLGVGNAIGQMEKLKGVSDEVRALASKALFGVQGGRVITAMGVTNYNKMIDAMRDQQTLGEKLNRVLDTTAAKWDAIKGTGMDVIASFVQPWKKNIGDLLDKGNAMLSNLQNWAKENPLLAKTIGGLVVGLGTFLLVGGGAAWVVGSLAGAFAKAAPLLAGFSKGIMAASPWLAVLAGVGYLLYKNWDVVAPEFEAAGSALKSAAGSAGNLIDQITGLFSPTDTATKKFHLFSSVAWGIARAFRVAAVSVLIVASAIEMAVDLVTGLYQVVSGIGWQIGKWVTGGKAEAQKVNPYIRGGYDKLRGVGDKFTSLQRPVLDLVGLGDKLLGPLPASASKPGAAQASSLAGALAEGPQWTPSPTVQVTHAPTINLYGTQVTKEDIMSVLRGSAEEVTGIVRRGMDINDRRCFS